MRKSLLLFVLLTALSAGLLAGACAAVQGRREAVSYRAEILAGDPAAADGVELTWVSTCGYHLFWHSTFPAAAPEEAETRFSYSGQKQSWIIELDEDVLGLSPGLNFLDIAPDSPSTGLRALWAELSAQTSPLPGDETYTEHNGLISIKREIQLADYLTDFPLSADRLAYTAWAADREFGTSQYDTSINAEELTRRFRAYFPIPVPEGLAMEISMTPDASGQLLSAHFLTLDSSLLTLQADCVSTGEGVLFALCAGGSMAKALDGSGIPGGWGIYRLSPGGDLETVYSIPNGGRAMAFWMGTVPSFFSPRRRARFFSPCWMQPRSPLLPPRSSFPRRRARPTHRCSHSLTALSASCPRATFWPCSTVGAAHGWWTLRRTPPSSPPWAVP